jgi:hypothetical protein
MDIIIFSVAFLAWYFASLILSETMGRKRKIGVEWSFFIAMMFSPVVGYVACLISGKRQ